MFIKHTIVSLRNVLMMLLEKIKKVIYPGKNTDSKEIKDLKNDMYSNTYCLIGFIFTIAYLILDYFIISKLIMALVSIVLSISIIIVMFISIKYMRNIIENSCSNLEKIKLRLENISSFTGLVAPVLFMISIIINLL